MTERNAAGTASQQVSGDSPWWWMPLDPPAVEQRRARLWLLAVSLGLVVVHAVVVGIDRPINWDEAIHVSQVNPAVPPVFMEPHRTRGLSLLVAPVAVFDPSMVALRLYLLLLGAAGTYAAFATWVRTIGIAAPIAAVVYSSFWITVFYSVEVLPNHPAALLSVALTGLFVAGLDGQLERRQLVAIAALMLLFASIRPPDAVMVGIGLALLALLSRRRRLVAPTAAAAIGGILGVLPWLLEGWFRFGFAPWQTVRSAGEYSVATGRTNLLPLYLQHIETRLRCAGGCVEDFVAAGGGWQLPPIRSSLFLLAAALLVVVAVVTSGARRWIVAVPLVVVVPVLAFYGYAGGAMNQRYLMPVYATVMLPAAIGFRAVWYQLGRERTPARVGVRVVLVVLVAITCWWSTSLTLERFESPSTRDRAYELGQRLAAETGRIGADCALAARVNYPQLQYWSGCLATAAGRAQDGELQPPLGELGSYVDLAAAAARGAELYAVDREALRDGSPLATWERVDPDAEPVDGYVLFRYVEGADLPPPPCPPAEQGPERRLAEVLSDDC
ncbi:MAG: hypothetical protein EA387_11175 [Nitriliruptor sp.]|nr:MAG: hypothetical protein EA387_11175 [Nitriliruptor sp.]